MKRLGCGFLRFLIGGRGGVLVASTEGALLTPGVGIGSSSAAVVVSESARFL